MLWWNSTQICN